MSITLYEVSKQLIANEHPMDSINFTQTMADISSAMDDKDYFMRLCKERNDYSIFITEGCNRKEISKELIPTLSNRGKVLVVDKGVSDYSWEIWIRDPITNENFLYILFDYSQGIIDCR